MKSKPSWPYYVTLIVCLWIAGMAIRTVAVTWQHVNHQVAEALP